MGNIDTYVQQNARDTVAERPLGEVDGLVLGYLAYYRFDGIVPGCGEGEPVSLRAAARLYEEKVGSSQRDVDAEFLKHIAASRRFGGAELSCFASVFRKREVQFAALMISFRKGPDVIVFRGVDESLTGWETAFRASFEVTEEQRLARDHLVRCMTDRAAQGKASGLRPEGQGAEKEYLVGGHSKGGNLALYAAAAAPKTLRDRIGQVFLFDSPGFAPGIAYLPGDLSGRVRQIVPQYALIGRLFETEAPRNIAAARGEGIWQHEPLHWQVEGERFVRADAPEKKSVRLSRVLNRWISRTSLAERKAFTAYLFSSLREERRIRTEDGKAAGSSGNRAESAGRTVRKKQGRFAVLRLVLRYYRRADRDAKRAARKLIRSVIAGFFHRI